LQVQQYSQEGNTMTDQLDNSWCYSASIYITRLTGYQLLLVPLTGPIKGHREFPGIYAYRIFNFLSQYTDARY